MEWPRSLLKGSDVDQLIGGENVKKALKRFWKVSLNYSLSSMREKAEKSDMLHNYATWGGIEAVKCFG